MNKGYIYIGYYDDSNILKIGMTQNAPSARKANIERTAGYCFTVRKYVYMNDINKSDLLFVESWVRRNLSNMQGIQYLEQSNDHFQLTTKKRDYDYFVDKAIKSVFDCLEFMQYNGKATIKYSR